MAIVRTYLSILLPALFASAFVAAPAPAATLTVPGGFATIQAALDAAAPGDVIEVDSGVYSEKVVFTNSGSAGGGPIVLTAAPGAITAPVIDGTGVAGDHLVLIADRSYVTVDGFELRNNLGVNDGSGVRITGAGTDIEIRNNQIHEIRGQNAMGITVYGTEPTPIENLVIDSNWIHDCDPKPSEALVLNGNVRAFEVTNNLVTDVNNIGIDFIGGESDIQPDQSLVAREGVCSGNSVLRASGNNFSGGIYVDGGRDIVIENNFVAECDLGIEIGAENPGLLTENVIVRNNVIARNLKAGIVFGGFQSSVGRANDNEFRGNTLYFNNTLGRSNGGEGEIWIQYAEDNVVENNIVYAGPENIFVASFGGSVNNTIDYNLFYSDAGAALGEFSLNDDYYTGLADWQAATGKDANSVDGDPLFAAPGANDFHIASTSPAVDAGNPAYVPVAGEEDLDGAGRLSGTTVDIGADEASCGDGVTDPGEVCDDGNAVNGDGCDDNCTVSACGNGALAPGEDCDDGNTIAGDCCDASCAFEAAASPCDDGISCTLVDACDGSGACVGDLTPNPVCFVPSDPGRAAISLKENGSKDSLSFKWGRGPDVDLADFGDPTTVAPYTLCVVEEFGGSFELLLEAQIPAGSDWESKGDKGFKYKRKDGSPDGITQVQLRPGVAGKAKLKLKGRGSELTLPSPLGIDPAATVTAQMRGGTLCVGAVFSSPFKKSDSSRFKDKSD